MVKEKKLIIVVDDEHLVLETVEEVLKKAGYNVIKASSGRDALNTLKKTKVDLVLSDVLMPGMSGLELAKKIRENVKLKNLKLAFLTVVNFSQKQMENLKKLNVVEYIQKPFDNEDLVRRVNKLIKKE